MSMLWQSNGWVLFLLPLVAFLAWRLGRRVAEQRGGRRVSRLSSSYFRGLNFLLNEQPDKAIEVFLQIAEVDKDTVETHFALGNLFRRRGEVDRAIRIHQNLIERPNLTEDQRLQAVLELGEDHMRAGLLDRAEALFVDLGEAHGAAAPKALHHLIWIYQQEKDWHKAIEYARRYETATGEPMGGILAQFYCELAEQSWQAGELEQARRYLREACAVDSHSLRAGIMAGRMAVDAGDETAAMQAFERVARHDADTLTIVLEPLLACYQRAQEPTRARQFLAEMIERFPGVSPVLALANLIEKDDGAQAAAEFLGRQLQRRPSIRGQNALIDLSHKAPDLSAETVLANVRELSGQLVASAIAFRCNHCGFGARTHHWQCPSCKRWDTVLPVHDAFGE